MRSMVRLATAAVLALTCAAPAAANKWNDKTTLKVDAPVMVPGTTLPAGTYVFKLMDSPSNRQLVQIFNEDESKLIATAQAIPTKRQDPKGDVVVRMNPTEKGAPAALKAWFYPGSLYGHEFVYSDEQARAIAERTKTLVLSTDVAGTDLQKGKLYLYDAEGRRGDWKEDAVVMNEWNTWREERRTTAKVAAPGAGEKAESSAPLVRSQSSGRELRVDELESNGKNYIGQRVTVTGEVEDVFGPRIFTIDEPGWADLEGEVLVHLPGTLAALVREEDRVTVTGTVRMVRRPDIAPDLDLFGFGADETEGFTRRPVLVADQIVGGNNNVALAIDVSHRSSSAPAAQSGRTDAAARGGKDGGNREAAGSAGRGTSGTAGTTGTAGSEPRTSGGTTSALTDPSALTGADREMVGRQVDVDGVKVVRLEGDHGFWIDAGGRSLFVLPIEQRQPGPRAGEAVSIEGVILQMPRNPRERASSSDKNTNRTVYIYATRIE